MLEQGGIQPGGLNFDAKLRRESTDIEDMFIAHIGKEANRQKHTILVGLCTHRSLVDTPGTSCNVNH